MKKIRGKLKKAFIPYIENSFQPSFLKPRTLFILAVVLLILKILIFSWFFYFPKTDQFAIVTSSRLIELTNQERTASGLQPLKVNQQLVQAAQQKAQDMINNNYFDHNSPIGTTPWYWLDKTGYKYVAAGENLARDFTESKFLHQAWMNSSSHRTNILNNKYQEIGIAVAEGIINGKRTVLAVQFFGSSFVRATEDKKALEEKPLAVSDTSIELPIISTEEKVEIKSGEVSLREKPKSILNTVTEKSEPLLQKIYFVVLALITLVVALTIFINIRVQYPKLILIAVIFIILIAAIALFNSQEFLNQGIDII